MNSFKTIFSLLAVFAGFAAAQTAASYTISTFAGAGPVGVDEGRNRGDGGPASQAWLDRPLSVLADNQGNVYIQVSTVNSVAFRKVDANGIINTLDPPPFSWPVILRPDGRLTIYAGYQGLLDVDGNGNSAADPIKLPNQYVSNVSSFAITPNGDVHLASAGLMFEHGDDRYRNVKYPGGHVLVTSTGKLLSYDSYSLGNGGFFLMDESRNFSAVTTPPCTFSTTLFVGRCSNENLYKQLDGSKDIATVGDVWAAAADSEGNVIFLDHFSSMFGPNQGEFCRVRILSADYSVRTIAGSTCQYGGDGGPALQGGFGSFSDITIDKSGTIYIAEYSSNRIRKLAPVATAPKITGFAQGASYQLNQVAPGSVFTIFGQGLGPASLTTLQMSGGKVATSLSGVRVLFGNLAAPLLYVSSGQISGLVPFETNRLTSVNVQVDRGGSLSGVFPVAIAPAVPGFFSADSRGKGQVAGLNQDYSVNGSDHPAKAASVVSLYGTGFGSMSQPFEDGAITGSTANLQLPVRVTVGGKEAQVLYAGAAPGAVAGVTQVNIVIPAGVSGHPEIQAKVGDAISPTGTTLTVQ